MRKLILLFLIFGVSFGSGNVAQNVESSDDKSVESNNPKSAESTKLESPNSQKSPQSLNTQSHKQDSSDENASFMARLNDLQKIIINAINNDFTIKDQITQNELDAQNDHYYANAMNKKIGNFKKAIKYFKVEQKNARQMKKLRDSMLYCYEIDGCKKKELTPSEFELTQVVNIFYTLDYLSLALLDEALREYYFGLAVRYCQDFYRYEEFDKTLMILYFATIALQSEIIQDEKSKLNKAKAKYKKLKSHLSKEESRILGKYF